MSLATATAVFLWVCVVIVSAGGAIVAYLLIQYIRERKYGFASAVGLFLACVIFFAAVFAWAAVAIPPDIAKDECYRAGGTPTSTGCTQNGREVTP